MRISSLFFLFIVFLSLGCSQPKWELSNPLAKDSQSNDLSKSKISFSQTLISIPEGSVIIMPATLTKPLETSASIQYQISGVTPADDDFDQPSGTVIIPAGESLVMFSVTSLSDSIFEGNRQFTISFSTESSDLLLETAAISVTIADDDAAPTLSIADVSSSNETGSLIFTVNLSGATAQSTTVSYTTSAVTATAGLDFNETQGSLTFAAGTTTQTISVPLSDDSLVEGTETFSMTLSNPSNATLADATATGTIIDDESYPVLNLGNASAQEDSGTISFTVTASAVSTVPIIFNYSSSPGTATTPADYTSVNASITMNPGETSKVIEVPIVNDSRYETNESLNLSITGGSGYTVLGSTLSATGVIDNDDAAPEVNFALSSTSLVEDSVTNTITINLSQISDVDVSVPFSLSGTATLGSLKDYTFSSSPLVIPAGDTTATLSFTVNQDSVFETNETVIVTLNSPAHGQLGDTIVHTLTINNDDSAPTITFASASQSQAENLGPINIQLSLSAASEVDVSIPFNLSGTAISSGTDYTIDASPVLIPAGNTTQSLVLVPNNESLFESNETAILTLGTPTNSTLGAIVAHTITITNDDSPPVANLSSSTQTVSETSATVSISVSLDQVSGVDTILPYIYSGTATFGPANDYNSSVTSLTIPSGQTTGTISFSINNDTKYESDETVICTLTTPTNATLGTSSVHTVTITSDDSVPTLSISDFTVQPGAMAKMTVTVSPVSGSPTTFDWSTTDGTAISPTDYTSNSGVGVSIPADTASIILNVSTVFQSVTQSSKNFSVNISNPGNATVLDGVGVATIQVPARGALDLGFANGLWDEGGGLANVKVIVVQADGKILVGGGKDNASGSIYRFHQNSTIDTTFGTSGRVNIDKITGYENVNAMALQTDGKIVATGRGPYNTIGAVYRLNTNGTFDTTFNSTGARVLPLGAVQDTSNAVAIQRDGKIVIAGATKVGADLEAFVLRLNSDGTTDTTFATSGIYTFDGSNADDSASSMLIQPDGKIVISGYSFTGATRYPMVLRLNSDGSFDSSFNSGSAKLFTGLSGSSFNSVAFQNGSKLLMSGGHGCGNAVGRLNEDGSFDTTFATVGYKTYSSTGAIGCEYGFQVITLNTGKFFILGNSNGWGMYICEFNSNGSYNTSFGTNGCTVHTPGFENVSYGFGAAMSPDGRILVSAGINTGMQVARLWNNTSGMPTANLSSTGDFSEGSLASAKLFIEGSVTWPISFNWQTTDQTATAGADYTAVSPTPVSLPGSSTGTILSTSTLPDGDNDSLETFIMSLIDITNATGTPSAVMTFSN